MGGTNRIIYLFAHDWHTGFVVFTLSPDRKLCFILEQIKRRFDNSHFYRGVGLYHLFYTCNKWTAKGSKKAGSEMIHCC